MPILLFVKHFLLLVCGVVLLFLVGRSVWIAINLQRYRSTLGTVLSSRVISEEEGRLNLHYPIIEYVYTVDNAPYRSGVYTMIPFDDSGNKEWATTVSASFVPGQPCLVYYSKYDPQSSTLTRVPRFRSAAIVFAGAVLGSLILLRSLPLCIVTIVGKGEVRELRASSSAIRR